MCLCLSQVRSGSNVPPASSDFLIPVESLNSLLTCSLCSGYLHNAVTITECLHSCMCSSLSHLKHDIILFSVVAVLYWWLTVVELFSCSTDDSARNYHYRAFLYFLWHSNTHPHTHPFNGPFSGTTRVSQYQKGKTNLDFTEARESEWQWYQLGHMQVFISLQTDNHVSTPPLKFFTGRMPFLPTNQQRRSTEGTNKQTWNSYVIVMLFLLSC